MRNIIAVLSVVGTLVAVGGCTSQRLQLSKSDPPRNAPKPEERVKYGFPWSKPKDELQVASKELPPELAEQLAKSRVTSPKTGVSKEALQRAADAEARGDLDSARAAYLSVVESDPKNVEAHHRLGVIADMRQDPQTADQHYAQAYALNRRDADLLCDMGYSLLLRGRFDDSERRLKEALEINAYHRAALSNLGLVYGKTGRYDEALAMFRQAGTESEAQRNIATLFPNGKPGSRPNATAIAEAKASPSPSTAMPPTGSAPAMPNDIDQRLIGLANDPVQPGSPVPQTQTLSQLGGLQPSLTPQSQGNPFAPPMNTAQPAVAAKPQGSGNPWTGSLANPLSPTDVVAFAAPPQPPMNANPYAMPPGNVPPANHWNQQPPAAMNNAWPPMDDVVPAGYSFDGNSFGQAPANPADASRWAAQMAMGAGPGSMIPLANAVQQPAAPSAYGSPAMSPSAGSMPFNYGNAAPANLSNLNIPATWATERPSTPPVEAIPPNGGQPSRWSQGEGLSPASPWAGSMSPASDSANWSLPPDNSASMVPMNQGYNPAQPSSNPNAVQPPPWSGNTSPAPWPPANGQTPQPTSSRGTSNWPVIQPGNAPQTASGPMMTPAAAGPTTSVQNWPYAPSRPN